MGVTLYRSTDASAPALTGLAGSLVALLDACLVNGYGAQPAAGWSIAYTGTSKRDYKQGAGSNGYYLDVNDAAPTIAQEARMRGYEAMTALGTGTQAFPTAAQSSFGVVCRKSITPDATARPWYLIADATCFHLFVDTGDLTNPSNAQAFHFGDFFSYKAGDTYNTAIIGRYAENSGIAGFDTFAVLAPPATPLTGATPGHYLDRTWTGVGGSLPFSKHSGLLAYGNVYGGIASATVMGNASCAVNYPNGPDGALELAPVWVGHNGSVRGYLKGLWCPQHFQPCGHGDTFAGTGNMAGKSFLALNVAGGPGVQGNLYGQTVIETSNTWS